MQFSLWAARPPRVVSVSIVGSPARRSRTTEARLDLMVAVARAIRSRGWENIDAVVFPAGYLRTSHWLAPLPGSARRFLIETSDVGQIASLAASRLAVGSPGCVFVIGIDTHHHRPWGFWGDQAAAAFDAGGCIGVTRKVFPVDGDTNEFGRSAYLLDRQDAAGSDRFVALPNGDKAMIAVCYDVFASSELALGPTAKLRAMRYRTDPDDGWAEFEPGERAEWLDAFSNQLARVRPTVVLNPIHQFARPGSCRFWQRHGLASASSVLDGALTVGAAHFKSRLPLVGESVLATAEVPASHIRDGNRRRGHEKTPKDGFDLRVGSPRSRALVRLYEG